MTAARGAAPLHRNSIPDNFHRAAVKYRERTALTFSGRAWSFAEIDRAAARIAHRLHALGLRKGDRVGAYARNSDAYLLLWLGCVRIGLVHVPINYALTAGELRYILDQSGAKALFYDPDLSAVVDVMRREAGVAHYGLVRDGAGDILSTALDKNAPRIDVSDANDEDHAQFCYTSGTTAAPKAAVMSHRAYVAEYMACAIELEFSARDVALAALPLYHTAQMHAFTMPQMLVGATTHLIETPAPDVVLELIERLGITSFFAPPTVWISLLRHPDFDKRDLRTLKNIYYGASIMPVPVLQELRQKLPGVRFYNCYGQTEIAPLATLLRPEDHDARPASAGRAILSVETRVVDFEMNDCAPGVHGEIVHRSPQLLNEYYNKPEETKEAFAGGWFHSGDVGYFDDEGYLFVVDRVKDIIKSGGVVVAGREVEEALFKHPSVSEVAVIGLPDPKWIEAVTAIVVLKPGFEPDEDALIAHAREHLAPFKVPKKVVYAQNLPRNTAGKLLKRELRVEYAKA
ncbi:MAG: AMP-binding protein [Hyphomicrobiales bacterium]|nr:AMP-binding protein [Hyphomicrobiales bacterium]